MATTSTIQRAGRSARFTGTKATYTVVYRVRTDVVETSPGRAIVLGQAAASTPVPALYATYSVTGDSDAGAFAQDFVATQPEPKDEPYLWDVAVTWRPWDGNTTQPTTSPEAREARFSVEFWDTQEIIGEAYNVSALTSSTTWRAANTLGPVVNAAEEQFHDALVEDDKIIVLVARKNFLTLTAVVDFHRAFNRSLNSDSFYGYSAHKAKFVGIEVGELIYEKSWSYYPATIKVALKDTEWYLPVVNKGMTARPAAGQKATAVLDDNGRPVSSPVLLAADGTKLALGTTGNVINYRTRRAVAYTGVSGLGIGGT